jgi:predicted transcriptional regulator
VPNPGKKKTEVSEGDSNMTISEVIQQLELTALSNTGPMNEAVTGGYVSDLLSHVMGQAKAGQIWITMQGHQNIVAVASLVGLSAVVIAGGIEPEEQTIAKANEQEVTLCKTSMSSFEVAGRLYQLSLKG